LRTVVLAMGSVFEWLSHLALIAEEVLIHMFRILTVEDDPKTLEELVRFLKAAVPEAEIVKATSIDIAIELVDKAAIPFDIAILDFKLPKESGGHAEVDESVCEKIRDTMPDTPIGHITGFSGDPAISQHVARFHPPTRKASFFLDKLSSEFGTELGRHVRAIVYGAMIESEIKSLHGAGSRADQSDLSNRFGTATPASLTTRFLGLRIAIAQYWNYLNPETQKYIEGYYVVTRPEGSPADTPYLVRPA